MVCSRCRARNGPAALQCYNCYHALREERDEQSGDGFAVSSQTATGQADDGAVGDGRQRLRQYGVGAVVIALLLMAFAWGGDWLGRRVVGQGELASPGKATLQVRYEQWKQAHAQPVERLMECYALEARIIRESGQKQTYQDLLLLAQSVRQLGTYNRVTDVTLPRFAFEGNQAIVNTRHRYAHTNPQYSPSLGDRTLIWERRNGRWLIVEDRFPGSYTLTR
jgi:hypothetical protein